MSIRQVINYDSSWPAVLEAARDARELVASGSSGYLLQPTVQRGVLSSAELSALAGRLVVVADLDRAPPLLTPDGEPNQARFQYLWKQYGFDELGDMSSGAGFSRQLVQATQQVARDVGQISSWTYALDIAQGHRSFLPCLRADAGDENDVRAPMRFRLSGERVTALAMINLSLHPDRLRYCPAADDRRLFHQLHEFAHVLQMKKDVPNAYSQRAEERDADQFAVTAFQTLAKGSPAVAARFIVERVLWGAQMTEECDQKYYFWPQQNERDLREAAVTVDGVKLCAAYQGRVFSQMPRPMLRRVWSSHRLGALGEESKIQFRREIRQMDDVYSQRPANDGFRGRIPELFRLVAKKSKFLGREELKFAQMACEAAAYFYPDYESELRRCRFVTGNAGMKIAASSRWIGRERGGVLSGLSHLLSR